MNYFMIFFLFILISFALAGGSMAPWVPTRQADIKRVLDILKMKPEENFLEIGTGDGRVSLAVAKKFQKSHITGIDLALPMFCVAYIKSYFSGIKNIKIKFWDAFKRDFWEYQHIYVYGMPESMQKKIVPKFLKEAQKWAKLYSYVFSIPEEYRKNSTSYGDEKQAKIHVLEKK